MKKSKKAALMSALLFPGIGHIYLKHYVRGITLISASLLALYYYISISFEKAMEITDKIRQGIVSLDVAEIEGLIAEQTTGAEAQILNMAMVAIVICWLIGIIDSYRLGARPE